MGIAIGRDRASWRPMTREDALRFRDIDSAIDGHPNPAEGFPFFPAATGSLGQGLSVGAGMALAARLDGFDKRIFCLIGDGESREGQIWEAVDLIADYRLAAVCPVFNCNGYGQADRVSPQQSAEVTTANLRGASFDVRTIDGHDPEEVRQALSEHAACSADPAARPFAVVARTVKGWGFSSVVGDNVHGQPVSRDGKDKALPALDAVAQWVGAAWTEGDLRIPPLPDAAPPRAEQLFGKAAVANVKLAYQSFKRIFSGDRLRSRAKDRDGSDEGVAPPDDVGEAADRQPFRPLTPGPYRRPPGGIARSALH